MLKSKGLVHCKVAFGWRLIARKSSNVIREVELLAPPLSSGEGRKAWRIKFNNVASDFLITPMQWDFETKHKSAKSRSLNRFLIGGHSDVLDSMLSSQRAPALAPSSLCLCTCYLAINYLNMYNKNDSSRCSDFPSSTTYSSKLANPKDVSILLDDRTSGWYQRATVGSHKPAQIQECSHPWDEDCQCSGVMFLKSGPFKVLK